jgi:hypothetical protein
VREWSISRNRSPSSRRLRRQRHDGHATD